ncbi:MAG: biotin transporter BioY [Finegoldia sp.]|nr:biotin transporter BioY [Finegoldia sp.]
MKTERLVNISLFAVITFISGFIRIDLGPVPITMQTLAVNFTALMLNPIDAAITMGLNLLLKLILNPGGGILSPSFGFLLGFILAASLGSLYLYKKGTGRKNIIIAIVIASLIPYFIGLPYMAYIIIGINGVEMSLMGIIETGFLIFIPGDLLKAGLAYVIGNKLLKIYPKMKN